MQSLTYKKKKKIDALAFHGDNGYVSYSAYFSILDGNTTSSEGSSETTTAIPCCSSIA